MKTRQVAKVITPRPTQDGAGVQLRRSIATPTLDHVDPFFLFDHFGSENSDDYIAGFPMHPHRGIETITYMLSGRVEHRDSLGNHGVIGAGDVQWMTAGKGIMHEEMPKHDAQGLDGFQVWVNLPAKLKMTSPRYQDLASAEIPEIVRPDGARIRIIAGSVDGQAGAVKDIFADPSYLDVTLPPGCSFHHALPPTHTALLYVFQGELRVGDEPTPIAATRLLLLSEGELLSVSAAGSSALRFLLLSAQPLNEPAVRWGPFVMNTREEIEIAIRQLRNGTFIEPS
jgi:redox-sensitive bicupin YhaK (pirin superfamily)